MWPNGNLDDWRVIGMDEIRRYDLVELANGCLAVAGNDARPGAEIELHTHGTIAVNLETVERVMPFPVRRIADALRLRGWPDWQDRYASNTAKQIAAGIVESGDWSRLAILADALQDAGCEDAALLGLMRLAGSIGLDMGGWWLMERMRGQNLLFGVEDVGPESLAEGETERIEIIPSLQG